MYLTLRFTLVLLPARNLDRESRFSCCAEYINKKHNPDSVLLDVFRLLHKRETMLLHTLGGCQCEGSQALVPLSRAIDYGDRWPGEADNVASSCIQSHTYKGQSHYIYLRTNCRYCNRLIWQVVLLLFQIKIDSGILRTFWLFVIYMECSLMLENSQRWGEYYSLIYGFYHNWIGYISFYLLIHLNKKNWFSIWYEIRSDIVFFMSIIFLHITVILFYLFVV